VSDPIFDPFALGFMRRALVGCVALLAVEPIRTTLGYGQVNTFLMALVVADLLPRWSQVGWEAVAACSARHEAQAPVAELAAQWDWRPALKAAQRAAAAGGGGAGGDELRRGALRAAKRMVNEVRAAASGVQNALARHALQLQRFD
jgi:hypothetical protein